MQISQALLVLVCILETFGAAPCLCHYAHNTLANKKETKLYLNNTQGKLVQSIYIYVIMWFLHMESGSD